MRKLPDGTYMYDTDSEFDKKLGFGFLYTLIAALVIVTFVFTIIELEDKSLSSILKVLLQPVLLLLILHVITQFIIHRWRDKIWCKLLVIFVIVPSCLALSFQPDIDFLLFLKAAIGKIPLSIAMFAAFFLFRKFQGWWSTRQRS